MKLEKKRFSAIIAFVLTLTIAATLITGLPFTFGQVHEGIPLIGTGTNIWVGPQPVGINQEILLIAPVTPRPPGYSQIYSESAKNVYEGVEFHIFLPDGTNETLVVDTNDRSEAYAYYNCTQLGVYSAYSRFPGDETHSGTTSSRVNWRCQEQPVSPNPVMGTYSSASVVSPVVQQGQTQAIIGWVNPPREVFSAIYYDCQFTVTKPSGATITRTTDTDTPATAFFAVVCDELGEWEVTFSYPGRLLHEGSTTPQPTTWIVQAEEVPATPQQPLPTYPWSWPVSAEYWEWYQITGPWRGVRAGTTDSTYVSSFNPYSKGPGTPHVLWKLPLSKSGMMGGDTGWFSWYESSPSGIQSGFVAAGGRLFYNFPERYASQEGRGPTHPVLYCLDQATGELIYKKDLPGTGSGGAPYLDMDQRFKIDPQVGLRDVSTYSIWFMSGGLWQVDPISGECSYYNPDLSGSSFYDHAIYMRNYPVNGNWTKWDCATRQPLWNIKLPTIDENIQLEGVYQGVYYAEPEYFWEDIGLVHTSTITAGYPVGWYGWTFNLTTGEQIASIALDSWSDQRDYPIFSGKVLQHSTDRRTRAVDLMTGNVVWTSEPKDYPWGSYTAYTNSFSWGPNGGGRDQYYVPSYSGYVYCYDMDNGHLLWKAFSKNTSETAMGVHGIYSPIIIADNKVYYSTGEHTAPQPLPREGALYCVDAVTGDRIWALDGFYRGSASMISSVAGISSGMLWYYNGYDGSLYMFGKGETMTTVSAPTTAVPLGEPVLIQGTVTDQSPGSKDTPAVSDASQESWVPYLYMNKPMPGDAAGVEVVLQGVRSDGTVFDIGRTTSDVLGHYEYAFTPDNDDTYKILATFEGSEAYWPSSGETALLVMEAPSPGTPIPPTTEPPTSEPPTTPPPTSEPPTTPPPTSEPPTTPPPTSEPPTEAPLISTEVAVAVAVAVVAVIGIGAYWVLRRQRSK